jgi:hypothetical protein
MTPAGTDRHCAACDKTVLDLSRRTEAEARTLLSDPGPHCVRIARRSDGSLVFRAAALMLAAAVAPAFADEPGVPTRDGPPVEAPLPAGTLRITVSSSDGKRLTGVRVTVTQPGRPDAPPRVGRTGPRGTVVFHGLHPGAWHWETTSSAWETQEGTVMLDKGTGQSVETEMYRVEFDVGEEG